MTSGDGANRQGLQRVQKMLEVNDLRLRMSEQRVWNVLKTKAAKNRNVQRVRRVLKKREERFESGTETGLGLKWMAG
jgi:hypothetical protein